MNRDLHLIFDRRAYDDAAAKLALHWAYPGTLVERGELTDEYVGRHRANGPSSHREERVATAVIGEGHTPRLGRIERFLFSRSRFRKSRILDALAVALLMSVCALLGCAVVMLSTGEAKADTSDALAYAAEYGPAVCQVLDEYPSFGGIIGISQSIIEHTGMSAYDTGQAIGYSVSEICPRHTGLLLRFAGSRIPRTPVAGVA